MRFYGDLRTINALSKVDIYPFPRVDDSVDRMEAAACVAEVGFIREGWQVPWIERIGEVFCFMAGGAMYQCEAVPCSLRSAPAAFRCLLGRVADGLQSVIVCLGAVVSCDATWCVRAGGMRAVFARLQGAVLVVTVVTDEVVESWEQSLSYGVARGCITSSGPQVEASRRSLAPPCRRVLQRTQGLVVYYWWFVPEHSTVLAPLTDLLQEEREWELGESCERAFCPHDSMLCSPPRLRTPASSPSLVLAVDDSQEGAGDCVS